MKSQLIKYKLPKQPTSGHLAPRVNLEPVEDVFAAYYANPGFGTFLGERHWGRRSSDISNLVFEPSEDEGQPAPPTQVALEARLVEDQIRAGLVQYFTGTTVYVPPTPSPDFSAANAKHAEKLNEVCERLGHIERTLEEVVKGVEKLRTQDRTIWVPINSFAPEPYELLQPITAVVTSVGEEFEASLFDANLYGAGDTEEEAISDLKAVIIEAFERLSGLESEKLGPAMVKQMQVLGAHIRKRGE